MKLIILTGAPASGKSSLAAEISKRTSIEFVSKDDLKIKLFEEHGFQSHKQKKDLSRLGEMMLYEKIEATIEKREDIIVDNNFKNYDSIRKFLENANIVIYCINCVANSQILAQRYNDRIASGNRHPALYTLNQYPIIEGVSKFHPIISADDVDRIQAEVQEKTFGNNVLKINTDHIENEFNVICDRIIDFCELAKTEGGEK